MTKPSHSEADAPQERSGSYSKQSGQEQSRREVGATTLVVFMLSVIALGFELRYVTDNQWSLSVDILALVAAVPRGREALSEQKPVVVALAIVVLIMSLVCAGVYWSRNLPPSPRRVEPQLYWQGPLDIGQQASFAFPTYGYTKAKIKFSVGDADPNDTLCKPNTRLDLAMGPQNNPQFLDEIDPNVSDPEKPVDLREDSDKALIFVTVTNTQQRANCPVTVRVDPILLANR